MNGKFDEAVGRVLCWFLPVLQNEGGSVQFKRDGDPMPAVLTLVGHKSARWQGTEWTRYFELLKT